MRRSEIEPKFDEIVAFAEVEQFIDTPVKHYSTGMTCVWPSRWPPTWNRRSCWSTRCSPSATRRSSGSAWGRWRTWPHGRTVLFVTHNMRAISACASARSARGSGGVALDGPSHQVVASHLVVGRRNDGREGSGGTPETGAGQRRSAPAGGQGGGVRHAGGGVTDTIRTAVSAVGIEMEFEVLEAGRPLSACFHFFDEEGLLLFGSLEADSKWEGEAETPPRALCDDRGVPNNSFSEGTVIVNAELLTTHPLTKHFGERQAVAFHVVDSLDGDSARGDWGGERKGAVRPKLEWAMPSPGDGRGSAAAGARKAGCSAVSSRP